jgi:hypothetical protein
MDYKIKKNTERKGITKNEGNTLREMKGNTLREVDTLKK